MSKINFSGNFRMIVMFGYVILFLLAVIGLARINKELVTFSKFKNPYEERKELNIVSNALVALYEAESVRKVLLSDEFYTPILQQNVDDIDSKIRIYIDSLYTTTQDDYLRASLDTVNTLLDEKKRNLAGMISLVDSIRKLPYNQVLTSQYLSKSDRSALDKMINDRQYQNRDTSYYIRERRNFLDRVKAVFSGKEDSTKVISTAGSYMTDSLNFVEPKILTDTLIKYFSNKNIKSDRRKIEYMTELSSRQNAMFYYDEMLTGQINSILRRIEDDERQIAENINNEKAAVLERSSKTVSHIAMASLFVLLLFMYLTMLLTDRNQKYREQLEKSNSLAQNLLKAKERLLLMIAHDVKAPLSSIIGHIEFMDKEQLPAEDREHLDIMRNSSEQILDLSNRMMHFHKLEKGIAELRIVPFEPFGLMNDIYKSFIPAAQKKNLNIESSVDIEPAQIYESDPFIIKQILNNLINNAIKFTEKGSISLKSSINADSGEMNISVKDTGVGISDEEKEKIFEEFGRGGSLESQQSIDGFGLGLPITLKLVTLLKGKLDFTSKQGEGTEFTLKIPVSNPVDHPAEIVPPDDKDCHEKLNARLLWIDDDEAILNLYSKIFERKGADVTKCYDSQGVFDLLKNNHFDLILTDIQMPKINGFELVKRIRKLGGIYAEIPIVALSARTDISEKDFKAAGFTTFVSKPIAFEHLHNITCMLTKANRELPEEEIIAENEHAAGFDALIEYVKDDKEISLEILNTFLEDNKEKTEILKKAAADEDWDTVKFISHKMMPLMTMIGANEILPIISDFESGGKNPENLKKLIPLVEKVNQKAERYIAEFELTDK